MGTQPPAVSIHTTFLLADARQVTVSTLVQPGIADFGREALLARDFLWDAVATRTPAPGTAPQLAAAQLALLAQRAALLPAETFDFLGEYGRDAGALVAALDARRELAALPPARLASHLALSGADAFDLRRIAHFSSVLTLYCPSPSHEN